MTTGTLRLYGESNWDSPFVFSVFVTLKEKGLSFETVEVDLGSGEHRRPPYRDLSLTEKVPTLEHDGFGIAESLAIIEYLEEAFPAPAYPALLPPGLRERARARQVLAWLRSDLAALRRDRPTTTMFFSRATTPLAEDAQKAASKLFRVSTALLDGGRRPQLFADFSIADADLAFMLQRLVINGDEVPPMLRDYAERHWQRPSVQAYVQHPRPAQPK